MTDEIILYTQSEAAEFLKNSTKTLESWRQKGKGPKFQKIGRNIRYSKLELLSFIKNNTFTSTSQY